MFHPLFSYIFNIYLSWMNILLKRMQFITHIFASSQMSELRPIPDKLSRIGNNLFYIKHFYHIISWPHGKSVSAPASPASESVDLGSNPTAGVNNVRDHQIAAAPGLRRDQNGQEKFSLYQAIRNQKNFFVSLNEIYIFSV